MNTLQEEVANKIISHWPTGDKSCAYNLFEKILHKYKSGATQHISFHALYKLVSDHEIVDVKDAIDYLSGYSVNLLKVGFYILDEEEEYIHLKNEDVKESLENNEFYHPITGEKIENFEKIIIIYYEGTELLNKLLKEQEQ